MALRRAALLVLGALVSVGCGETVPRTQVMVIIDADPGIRRDADDLSVQVRGGLADAIDPTLLLDEPFVFADDDVEWPVRVGLVPRDGQAGRGFAVVATARMAEIPFARVQAFGGYLPRRTVELRLRIHDACRDVLTCDTDQTCGPGGMCITAEVAPCQLAPPGGGDTCPAPDDAGPSNPPDGGLDAGSSPDAGGPTMGFRDVTAGHFFTCALGVDESVWCWGSNAEGQLGVGTAPSRELTPVQVVGLAGAMSVTAGWNYACAVLRGGRVVCWGDNRAGQLGVGSMTSANLPTVVFGIAGTEVSAGGFFSIAEGHTCARHATGAVSCWGDNGLGQLGTGTTDSTTTPTSASATGVDLISVGAAHTCALQMRRVSCWGLNSFGQLGTGDTAMRLLPTPVAGLDDVSQVSAGAQHTCAVGASGAAWCWGRGNSGRLGHGSDSDRATPVGIGTTRDFVDIAAGGAFTCARHADGTVSCWGLDTGGELGDGPPLESRNTPGLVPGVTDAIEVAVGLGHACVVHASGEVSCWGLGRSGQLGNGDGDDRLFATRITNP